MNYTSLIGALAVLILGSFPAGGALAVSQCEGINTSSVGQLQNCINSSPQFKNMMPQIIGSITGCQFAKLMYKSASGNRSTSIPACSVFAQALAEVSGNIPVWSDCTEHYENEGDISSCFNKIVAGMESTGRAMNTACPDMQKMATFIAAAMLEPIAARRYQAPSCDVIAKALQANKSDGVINISNFASSSKESSDMSDKSSQSSSKSKTKSKDPFKQYRQVPTAKVWEVKKDMPRYMSPDGINVSLSPESRLGPTGFNAAGFDKINSVQGVFHGTCESIMRIDVTLQDWRKFDFTSYKQSEDGKDLPIKNTLDALRDVLKVQCSQLRGFIVNATVLYKQVPTYQGHMLASNGWSLDKGLPKEGFGNDYVVKIQMSTSFMGSDGLIVVHRGKCEAKPTLLIKRHFLNNTQKAFPKKRYINEFQQLAASVTQQYIHECPQTEAIHFRIEKGVLPARYVCEKPQQCLIARKNNNWEIDKTAIAFRVADVSHQKKCLTNTYCGYKGGDLLNAIYEGDFEHFRKLDHEYTKGYVDFLKSQQTGNAILDNMFKRASIMDALINEYMFQYKSTSGRCLRENFKTLVFKRQTSDIVLENVYGIEAHRISGVDLEASYTVNREFVDVCKETGSAVGGSSLLGQMGDKWFNNGMRIEALFGIKDLMAKEACDSVEILQFEKNMLSFYRRI